MAKPFIDILVDDHTWSVASKARRLEWRLVLDEIIAEQEFGVDIAEPVRMLLTVAPDGVVVDVRTDAGHDFLRFDVPTPELAEHLREYLDICRDMGRVGESTNSPRLEALDIAKRISHDEAADSVARLCAPLRPDHATARRLFTLLVTLHYDTTRLLTQHRQPPARR